jgi:predicted nucleic acid-binding protein
MSGAGDRFFVDTNVLLYWLDSSDTAKQRIAGQWVTALWEHGCGAISWQVLNEFYTNAIRKIGASKKIARAVVEGYSEWSPAGFDVPLVKRAWHWSDQAGMPHWDALIVAAAERTGCRYLLSEDFQPGRRFGDLTVVNPFQSSPDEFFARAVP